MSLFLSLASATAARNSLQARAMARSQVRAQVIRIPQWRRCPNRRSIACELSLVTATACRHAESRSNHYFESLAMEVLVGSVLGAAHTLYVHKLSSVLNLHQSFRTCAPLAGPGVYCSRSVIFFFSLSSFSLVLIDPCGRGGVREHLRERTRTGGTEPARHPSLEMVRVSAGRDGAVRPPWIPRNRPLAAPAGALTRSAAAYEVDARSLRPTVVTRPGGSISRGGSAPQ
jgi:hypothetical protein